MSRLMKPRFFPVVLVAGLMLSAGCANRMARGTIPGTVPADAIPSGYQLRPLDPIQISLLGIPDEKVIDTVIDERGEITLPFIEQPVRAEGLTATGLQREIQRIYIDEQIYRTITVNVLTSAKSYFMEGEVRQPREYPMMRRITLLQAIAAAGGYTEYANPRNVRITRGGQILRFNARDIERNPDMDPVIEAGDRINVGRSIF